METLITLGNSLFAFIIVISVIVFIHEMGHYLVAKWCGVKIEEFSIGMGKELFGWSDKSGTRWKVAVFPVGGFVKMFGDAGASSKTDHDAVKQMSEADKSRTFESKTLPQKTAIVAAGPFANFILTIAILTFMILTNGMPSTEPIIGGVMEDSPAAVAGLTKGDRIVSIDGEQMERFNDVVMALSTNLGTPVELQIERDQKHVTLTLTPKQTETDDGFGNKITRPLIGVSSPILKFEEVALLPAMVEATKRTYTICTTTLHAVGQIISGDRSIKDLKSPVGIAQLSGQAAEKGYSTLLWLIAMLSANLGLINLFPIPLLDGGHLAFYAVEAVRGRSLAEQTQEWGFRIGMAMIVTLMVVTIYNDVVGIFFS